MKYWVLFAVFIFIIHCVYEGAKHDQLQQEVITTQQDLIAEQAEVIDRYAAIVDDFKAMIAWDDVLLNAFTHDTWDRGCSYEVVPGIILADGSIRSSVIQICEDLGPIIDEKIERMRKQ